MLLYGPGWIPHSTEAVIPATDPTPPDRDGSTRHQASRSVHGNLYFDQLENRLWSPVSIKNRCHGAPTCSVDWRLLAYCPSVAQRLPLCDAISSPNACARSKSRKGMLAA